MMLMLQKIWTTVLLVHKRVDDLDKRLQVPNKNSSAQRELPTPRSLKDEDMTF